MTAYFRKKIYYKIGIHEGEKRKTFFFLTLQFIISAAIGLLSSGIEPLFYRHTPGKTEMMLYNFFVSARHIPKTEDLVPLFLAISGIFLVMAGLFYSALTDHVDKKKLFSGSLISAAIISFIFYAFTAAEFYPPLFFGLLYIWRFVCGVTFLFLYWENIRIFFRGRQINRLFPLLAVGGAVGYSTGSFTASLFQNTTLFDLNTVLLLNGFLAVSAAIIFRKGFHISAVCLPPRYKKQPALKEISEGLRVFKTNEYIRMLGISTFIFGLISGFIMSSYNRIITENLIGIENVSMFLSRQRAAASILQAVIVSKLISSDKAGRGSWKQLIFKFLMIIPFLITMVGIADFTRQIAVALLSPHAIAAFSIVHSDERGRVMTLNSLVFASAGLFSAAAVSSVLITYIPSVYFIYIIIFLMLLRPTVNLAASSAYIRELTKNIKTRRYLVNSRDHASYFLNDPVKIQLFFNANDSFNKKVFLWKNLAENIQTKDEVEKIKPYKPDKSDPLFSYWMRIISFFPGEHLEELENIYQSAPSQNSKEAAKILLSYYKIHDHKKYKNETKRITETLNHQAGLYRQKKGEGSEKPDEKKILNLTYILSFTEPEKTEDLIRTFLPLVSKPFHVKLLNHIAPETLQKLSDISADLFISTETHQEGNSLLLKTASIPDETIKNIISRLKSFQEKPEIYYPFCTNLLTILDSQKTRIAEQTFQQIFYRELSVFTEIDQADMKNILRTDFKMLRSYKIFLSALLAKGTVVFEKPPKDIKAILQKMILFFRIATAVPYLCWYHDKYKSSKTNRLLVRYFEHDIREKVHLILLCEAILTSNPEGSQMLTADAKDILQNGFKADHTYEATNIFVSKKNKAFLKIFTDILSDKIRIQKLRRQHHGKTLITFRELLETWNSCSGQNFPEWKRDFLETLLNETKGDQF